MIAKAVTGMSLIAFAENVSANQVTLAMEKFVSQARLVSIMA